MFSVGISPRSAASAAFSAASDSLALGKSTHASRGASTMSSTHSSIGGRHASVSAELHEKPKRWCSPEREIHRGPPTPGAPPAVVAKIDIESAEFTVIPRMIATRAAGLSADAALWRGL